MSVLSIVGKSFLLNGEPFDMWGIRTVNALWDDEVQQRFLNFMDEAKQYGFNTFGVNLQGGSPGFTIDPETGKWWENNSFNSDGSLKDEYMNRLRTILEKAEQIGAILNVGYFYQGQCRKASETTGLDYDHWVDDAAIYQAARNATEWLRPYRNVIIDIANEFGHSYYQHDTIFPYHKNISWDELEYKAKILVDIVHEVDTDRIVNTSPTSDKGIIDVSTAKICYTHGHAQPYQSGGRPQVNNEQWFRDEWQSGLYGVYTSEAKQDVLSDMRKEREYGNVWFWGSAYLQFHPFPFDIVGDGTEQNPGDKWLFTSVNDFRSYGVARADFKMSTDRMKVGVAVKFSDSSYRKEDIVKWVIDFGDGTIRAFKQPATIMYKYKSPGVFVVKLRTVDKYRNVDECQKSITIVTGERRAGKINVRILQLFCNDLYKQAQNLAREYRDEDNWKNDEMHGRYSAMMDVRARLLRVLEENVE